MIELETSYKKGNTIKKLRCRMEVLEVINLDSKETEQYTVVEVIEVSRNGKPVNETIHISIHDYDPSEKSRSNLNSALLGAFMEITLLGDPVKASFIKKLNQVT